MITQAEVVAGSSFMTTGKALNDDGSKLYGFSARGGPKSAEGLSAWHGTQARHLYCALSRRVVNPLCAGVRLIGECYRVAYWWCLSTFFCAGDFLTCHFPWSQEQMDGLISPMGGDFLFRLPDYYFTVPFAIGWPV